MPKILQPALRECAQKIAAAQKRKAGVMLLYGAHLIKNGGAKVMNRLMESGWVTHLGTNGAGSSRSASREAEGTGPTTPRQPAASQVTGIDCVVPIPAERRLSVRRMSSERRKELA